MDEELTRSKLIMFAFIIAGLVLFTVGSFRRRNKDPGAADAT